MTCVQRAQDTGAQGYNCGLVLGDLTFACTRQSRALPLPTTSPVPVPLPAGARGVGARCLCLVLASPSPFLRAGNKPSLKPARAPERFQRNPFLNSIHRKLQKERLSRATQHIPYILMQEPR